MQVSKVTLEICFLDLRLSDGFTTQNIIVIVIPSDLDSILLILLLQPSLERCEVFSESIGVHSWFSCHYSHGFLPGLGASKLQHFLEFVAGLVGAIEVALMQRLVGVSFHIFA